MATPPPKTVAKTSMTLDQFLEAAYASGAPYIVLPKSPYDVANGVSTKGFIFKCSDIGYKAGTAPGHWQVQTQAEAQEAATEANGA